MLCCVSKCDPFNVPLSEHKLCSWSRACQMSCVQESHFMDLKNVNTIEWSISAYRTHASNEQKSENSLPRNSLLRIIVTHPARVGVSIIPACCALWFCVYANVLREHKVCNVRSAINRPKVGSERQTPRSRSPSSGSSGVTGWNLTKTLLSTWKPLFRRVSFQFTPLDVHRALSCASSAPDNFITRAGI